jgi:hypothetical protein
MANENQNTGPQQNPSKSILDAKEALKLLIEDQGDYNNLLKSSLRDLDSMQKSYTRIAARIDALNKGSINVKQVQQELARLNQKEYIAKQKVLDLESGLSEETKRQQKNAEVLNSLYKKAVTEKERERIERQIAINNAKLAGNIEIQNLEHARVAAKISEEETKNGQKILETEKKVSKQMGISGNLAKMLADKLGVGEEAYEAMSFEARKLVKEQGDQVSSAGKWKVAAKGIGAAGKALISNIFDPAVLLGGAGAAFNLLSKGLSGVGNAAAKTGNFLAGLSQDSSNIVRGLTSGLSDIARKIPFVGGLLGGLIDGFSAVLDLVLGVDNFIIKSGRDLNLNTQQARALNREFQNISFNSGNIFTTSRKLLESQVELSNQLGVVNRLTTEQLETNIMLKDIAGLELETRQQIVEVSTITGQTSQNVVKSVLAQVQGLKNATGIQLQNKQVLKEAASLGGYLGLQFAKYPAQLTKSLVTVKAMGMELKQLDSIADSFLDFESSISKEFEAQLLTGKEINLAKAREAFLNNDLATAASEITRQVGSANDFLKLNRIQAESLASAFGMSRDQLGEMLKRQELLSTLGAKDTDNAQKQLQLGLQKFQNQKALTAAIGEEAYQNLVNASTQEKMASFIEKIKQSIVDFVERSGIIEKVQGFIDYISKPENVKKVLIAVRDTFADIAEVVLTITNGVINAIDAVTLGFGIDEDWERKFEKWSESAPDRIRSMGGDFESLSVGNNAANSQVAASSTTINQYDNMSMRPGSNAPKVYNVIIVDPVSGKVIENEVSQTTYETVLGQMGKR